MNYIITSEIKAGIAYQRPLPTNQIISYAMYDEAWHLDAGTYDYTPPSNPVWMAELDTTATEPILTLKNNNEYGNKDRFTDIDGLQVYADNYVIDHLTGLGWDITIQPNQLWNQHLIDAEVNTMLGYSDFRVPTSTEGVSLFNYAVTTRNAMQYPPFNVGDNTLLASSSVGVYHPQGIKFMAISAIWGYLNFNSNITISNVYGLYCRNHFNDSDITSPIVPVYSGISYQRDYYTFQETSYSIYDDGWQLINGGYDFVEPLHPLYCQRLDVITDPTGLTLFHYNEFGNKFRFTNIDGTISTGLVLSGTYTIDHLTGLAYMDNNAFSFTSNYDTYMGVGGKLEGYNTTNLGGFNDWFIPNYKMFGSLVNKKVGVSVSQLILPVAGQYGMRPLISTTNPANTTQCYRALTGEVRVHTKTTNTEGIVARVHYK